MKNVQPIREVLKIEQMKEELKKSSSRNYLMFYLGINTGLRISDILALRVSDVKEKGHIVIREQKTDKVKRFKLNEGVSIELKRHIEKLKEDDHLFISNKGKNKPVSRIQAYRILNQAAINIGLSEIGTHTLRKTFGYHLYNKTKDVALLQQLFNHSSPSITLKYIGINQDIMDKVIDDFEL